MVINSSAAAELELPADHQLASRYRIRGLIGSGGMARVYRALDEATGREVAIKHLTTAPDKQYSPTLFQREYSTLAQLAHPNIVQVSDYGIDAGVPFYVMELLEGESLRALAPLPWRETCSLLRDVACALGLVHSRRLVHRDVTPRNIYRTPDGQAKLLDFGSLCPMGIARELVGTPPFLPPESVEGQPLDGRADLFSLGAVAYFALTGRLAFPAAHLTGLPALWLNPVPPPSTFAEGVPPALDALVLSLLGTTPYSRPENAGEVFDRLTAIADLSASTAPEVAQAYLALPSFVGREYAVRRFQRILTRCTRGRGTTLILEGRSGVGRSRLLSHFVREAKLNGLIALRVGSAEVSPEPFGIARHLTEQMRAHDAAGERRPAPAAVETYVTDFATFAETRAVLLAVDDIEQCDEQSMAVLERLSDLTASRRLILVVSTRTSASEKVVRRLRGTRRLLVRPLSEPDTQAVFSSMFGDVPYVESIASWAHRLAEGNPQRALELAQQLVDQKIARFEDGRWQLPESLAQLKLPQSIDQALAARIALLTPAARSLAEALSLTADQDPLLLAEYAQLGAESQLMDVLAAALELESASILMERGASYVFVNRELKVALRNGIENERARIIHGRLARAYSVNVLAAHHHLQAGEPALAFAKLVATRDKRASSFSGRGSAFLRSSDGLRLYDAIFEWAKTHDVPPLQFAKLGKTILQLAAVGDEQLIRHAPTILERLRRDSGLVYWQRFSDIEDPFDRAQRCVGEAFAVYQKTPEKLRGPDPARAIQWLATAAGGMTAVYARLGNARAITTLAELVAPLRPLSPGIDVLFNMIQYTARSVRGQTARDLKLRVLAQVAEPVFGIDETTRTALDLFTRYYIALEEVLTGNETDLDRLRPLSAHPMFAALIWQIHMLAALLRGQQDEAESFRRKRDLAVAGELPVERHLETSAHYETLIYVALGDLRALRQMLPVLKLRARRAPSWHIDYCLALGVCHALRGDYRRAIDAFEQGRNALDGPLEHACWAALVTNLAKALISSNRAEEAARIARDALTDAELLELPAIRTSQIEMALALALAHVGDHSKAIEHGRLALARAEREQVGGVLVMELCVEYARVAILSEDEATFNSSVERVRALGIKLDRQPFAAKKTAELAALEAMRSRTSSSTVAAPSVADGISTTFLDRIGPELGRCRSRSERAELGLQFLLEYSQSEQAFLYLDTTSGPTLMASLDNAQPSPELDRRIRQAFDAFEMTSEHTVTANAEESGSLSSDDGFDLVPIQFARDMRSILVGVLAVAPRSAQRPIPARTLHALGRGLAEPPRPSEAPPPFAVNTVSDPIDSFASPSATRNRSPRDA